MKACHNNLVLLTRGIRSAEWTSKLGSSFNEFHVWTHVCLASRTSNWPLFVLNDGRSTLTQQLIDIIEHLIERKSIHFSIEQTS